MPGRTSSSRSAARNKKYSVDAFEGISDLEGDDQPDDPSHIPDDLSSSSEDFDVTELISDEDADADPDENPDAEVYPYPSLQPPKKKYHRTPQTRLGNARRRPRDVTSQKKERKESKRRTRDPDARSLAPGVSVEDQVFFRGYPSGLAQCPAKEVRRMYFFGGAEKDHVWPMRTRRRYMLEPCLPSRTANSEGLGGFAASPALRRETQRADENWAWYDRDGGRQAFLMRQKMVSIDSAAAEVYLRGGSDRVQSRALVFGPVNYMTLFHLESGQSLPLTAAFGTHDEDQLSEYKRGFIINLGARVHCLDWAPNRPDQQKQYLAVSILPARPEDNPATPHPEGRSFVPLPAYKSAIQIWEFTADANYSIDITIPPRRRLTLCTDVGDIKTFKWCPVPCNSGDRLGLLACVTNDGALRVYDIPRIDESSEHESAVHITQAAFEARAPHTVYTTLTWLSSRRLAAGCANGCLAVWDLADYIHTASTSPRPPRPAKYFSLSTTYILALESCYPSLPDHIISSSMSGYLTLTDLRHPQPGGPSATVSSARSRAGHTQLLWHEHVQSAISIDDADNFRAAPLRMFFVSCGFGRERSHGMAMAVSPVHPFVLVGTAGGDVLATNPTPRVVGGGKAPVWMQKWFAHEWRRPREDEVQAAERATRLTSNPLHPEHGFAPETARSKVIIAETGMSRMVEGFKAEKVTLAGNDLKHANVKDGVIYTTIFEEPTAITALAWNPNLKVAGWAAAGMADGLLRVEDLAG